MFLQIVLAYETGHTGYEGFPSASIIPDCWRVGTAAAMGAPKTELVQAKIEQRAPEVEVEASKGESPKVINIMDALKKSMQARGQTKLSDAVLKKSKTAPKREASPRSARPRDASRRAAH